MSTATQPQRTNDLRHTIDTFDKDGNSMRIKIKLNDECKNGHQDFSITADVWEKGKPKTDRYYIMGGCCHDEILAVMPDLKLFVNLHLCDYKGIPMHAIENGFHHLREGFNEIKPDNEGFKTKFCEYYRITPQQFDVLNTAENKTQYALFLMALNVLEQWEAQANEAISQLEKWTKKTFLVDSIKTQFNIPTPKEVAEEKTRLESGYYTIEAKEQRRKGVIAKERAEIEDYFKKQIEKLKTEENIKLQLFDIGGNLAVSNTIYYSHTKQISFNWQSKYGNGRKPLSDQLINKIKAEMKLPDGVTFEN